MNSKVLLTAGAIVSSAALAWNYKSVVPNTDKKIILDAECSTKGSNITRLNENSLNIAINKSRDLLWRIKDEVGAPGIVIGVSINGETIWKEGLGFSNVENRSPCHEDTVMRIASISKSMTMSIVAKLWEEGKLDLDAPVQKYVPSFPNKTYDGKPVEITTRMLVSHLSGIRHYVKKGEKEEKEFSATNSDSKKEKPISTRIKEVFNKDKFDSIEKALSMFKDDELMSKPGTKYLYSTHGWTLISAVVEGAGKEPFTKQAKRLFVQLGLHSTRLDEFEPIIYNRASYYRTTSHGRMVNVPFTDTSYKWAGGGFVSTVGDLIKFGNIMLYSYQWKQGITVKDGKIITNYVTDKPEHPIPDLPPGYLKSDTIKMLWTPVPITKGEANNGLKYRDDGYGMGWKVAPYKAEYGTTGGGDIQNFHACHSGAAVGASSILFILPSDNQSIIPPPKGICVAIITNMENVGLGSVADQIAHIFADTKN